jgi:DNA-binding transcriptional LysR family regulator
MRLPDLEAWAIFATVADQRSFTRAARELGLSKATVSKAVSRLEAELGTSLFSRTSRQLALTQSGVRLADHAARLLDEGRAAQEAAHSERGDLAGEIRLGAPMSFGIGHVAPAIADFMSLHPKVAVDLCLSDATVDLIAERLDMTLRIAALPDSSLIARRLRPVRNHVVAAPALVTARGAPASPFALAGWPAIAYGNARHPAQWRLTGPAGETVAIDLAVRLVANNGEAMLPALRAGLGVAVLPDFIADADVAAGRLVRLLEDWRLPPLDLYLVTPPSRLRSARVGALARFLLDRFAQR